MYKIKPGRSFRYKHISLRNGNYICSISALLKPCLKNIFIFNSHGKLESELKSCYNLGLEGAGGQLSAVTLPQGPQEFRVNKCITYLKSHLEKCLYLSLSTIN